MLRAVLPGPLTSLVNRDELKQAAGRCAVAFVEYEQLARVDGASLRIPIIAIVDSRPADTLGATIRALDEYPWLSHVISAGLLATPRAPAHLAAVIERFAGGPAEPLLGRAGVGRVALLATASRRTARFDRMRDFFARQALSERAIVTILEVAEELVMNALYDAPSEAGYFHRPRQRVEDVDLPHHLACEISYGIEDDIVFVRLRDPFGALPRARLVEVLVRCNSRSVALDESRGGAGLGLWRVFSTAAHVAITVIPGALTDVVIGIATRDGRAIPKQQLQSLHLFFAPRSEHYESLAIVADDDHGLLDQSITINHVA